MRRVCEEIQKQVVEMRLRGVTREEISRLLGITIGSVKHILSTHNISLPMEIRQENARNGQKPENMEHMRKSLTKEVVQKRSESIKKAYQSEELRELKSSQSKEYWKGLSPEEINYIKISRSGENSPQFKKMCDGQSIEEALQANADVFGGRFIGPYGGSKALCKWKCLEGHVFKMTPNLVRLGHWCQICGKRAAAKKMRHDGSWLTELAQQNEGECLTPQDNYTNNKMMCKWKCKNGHIFNAIPHNIRIGSWCPYCVHRHSKPELQIFDFVKNLFPDALNGQRKLLASPKLELDIYIPSLHKAIEFDGDYWHSLPDSQERDLEKSQQCQLVGIQLLRVKESDFIQNPQQVFDMIEQFLQAEPSPL